MVGYDSSKYNPKALECASAAAASGATTRFLCQPLDVVKIRFQLQVEHISVKNQCAKYRSISQAFLTICKEEGLSGLWKGHTPAQLLSAVYGITQFVTFEVLTKKLAVFNPSWSQSSFLYFGCGAAATGFATLFSFPFDVMRTRFIAQGNVKVYHNIGEGFSKLCEMEGRKAMFKGLSPTIIQSAPYGGAQFFFYNLFRIQFVGTSDTDMMQPLGKVAAGFCSGMCSKTVVYPFDICRKRLQIQGFHSVRTTFGEPFICNGLMDCVRKTYQRESFRGFFKGLQPSMLKAAIVTALQFTLYDGFIDYFSSHRE